MRLLIIIASLCVAPVGAHAQPGHAIHDHAGLSEGAPPESALPDPSEPINAMCPVMTDEEVDPRFTAQYKGHTIGLCCRKCLTKFNKNPEKYLANITALAPGVPTAEPAEAPAGDTHEDPAAHDQSEPDHTGPDPAEPAEPSHDAAIHDHDKDHDKASPLLAWLGKLHPPATHLPIGLLVGALIAEVGLVLTRKDLFRHAASFCIVVAAMGAVGAATLGWFNGGLALVDDDWVQTTHRWLGTSTAILSVLTCLVLARTSRGAPDHTPSRSSLRVMLVITVVMVSATGFFGGSLIYGLDHYAW